MLRSISIMLMVTIIIYLMVIINNIDAASKTNDCDRKKADQCSLNLIPITNEEILRKLPKTIGDIDSYCGKINRYEKCMRKYAENCLKKQTKQTLSVIIYSIGRMNKKYCQKESKKKLLLNLIQCSGQTAIKYYSDLIQNVSNQMHGIRTYSDVKLRIPMVCCLYNKISAEAMEYSDKICPKYTNEVDSILRGYSGDALNLLCGEYGDDSDKCDSILTKIPDWKGKIEWKSFIMMIAMLVDSLE
ncbi:hypothetical protein DERP_008400 [Dermatophagoides pteronyssinus]|uniref:Uncharacterized protein n=2 Tax=Dermatophagoides pteronyssinus TaxID=6956 RepID=A0ABQ8IV66_DERPT|nr:uncharacterized protein LOC113796277 [Dermatophagoides pteronyssinus]KAH9414205.1 hypothetical protein DERP_008400 [Dermatophagoides pteronyssinus]